MESTNYDAMGERVFNRLSVQEKDLLMGLLSDAMAASSSSSSSSKWSAVVKAKINDVIQRRQEEGDSLDASDVVDEVLPLAIAAIPEDVRMGLFSKLRKMLATPSK